MTDIARSLIIDAARLARMAYASPDKVDKLYRAAHDGQVSVKDDVETVEVLKRVTSPPTYFADDNSDAQGYGIQYSGSDGPINMLVYRGTSNLADCLADGNVQLVPLVTQLAKAPKGVLVHNGFSGQFRALESESNEFLSKVYDLSGTVDKPLLRATTGDEDTPAPEQAPASAESVPDDVTSAAPEPAQAADKDTPAPEQAPDDNTSIPEPAKAAGKDTAPEQAPDSILQPVSLPSLHDLPNVGKLVAEKFPAVSSTVANQIDEQSRKSFMGGPPILVVGHSLAAAVAAVGALVFALQYGQGVSYIGFGTPRVGNSAWKTLFNKTIENAIRLKHARDPIDSILAPIVYRHIGSKIHVGAADPFPDLCLLSDICDHDMDQYIVHLKQDDTSEKPLKWIPYIVGFVVNTPVSMYNFLRSTAFYSPF